jgi:hypothetical protein
VSGLALVYVVGSGLELVGLVTVASAGLVVSTAGNLAAL